MWMNVEIGFAPDFVTSNVKEAFIFAVNQKVAQLEVFNENECGCVIHNIHQTPLARAKRLFGPLTFGNIAHDAGKETPVIPDVLSKRDFDREFSTVLVQTEKFNTSPIDVSLSRDHIFTQRAKMPNPEALGHQRREVLS